MTYASGHWIAFRSLHGRLVSSAGSRAYARCSDCRIVRLRRQQSATPAAGERNAATSSPESTAAQTPAAADAAKPAAAGDKPELTSADKQMMARGYKLQMRHGEKYFCRREAPVGSHLEIMECNTADSIEAKEASSQEMVRRMQVYSPKASN